MLTLMVNGLRPDQTKGRFPYWPEKRFPYWPGHRRVPNNNDINAKPKLREQSAWKSIWMDFVCCVVCSSPVVLAFWRVQHDDLYLYSIFTVGPPSTDISMCCTISEEVYVESRTDYIRTGHSHTHKPN